VRQEKLALLGQIAGGVGHELRNPLGVIKNTAYFLKMALEKPGPEVKESLEILDKEVANSERIITTLLDFARSRPPQRQKVDINEILREVLSSVNTPGNIQVVNQAAESLPLIMADPGQLGQVFGNFILNTVQAMPQGGQLIIKSETQDPGWAAVSIADTGVGIPEENIEKIFEPLFTTKAKGIGLGMAISKTFVEGHGGSIDVQSEIGKGSTFTIKLPALKKEEGGKPV
jgi:signal transduction histidine kinase